MNKCFISALDEQFKYDCKVINLSYEYPGYTGEEKWAIITDLSEGELNKKYAEQISLFTPFIVLPTSFGELREEYIRNEHKHEMRSKLYGDQFSIDDNLEIYHPELIVNDLLESIVFDDEINQIKYAIQSLNKYQSSRIARYFLQDKTLKEIAEEDNISISAVYYSIQCGINNLKKFFKQT